MTPLILACLWFVAANVIAILPSRDHHWRAAFVLIGLGIPLLGWLTWKHGPLIGVLVLLGAVSILRWPLLYLWRWIARMMARVRG